MEARQEVRLKEAEAADQKETANRDRFAEPTASIIGEWAGEVHRKSDATMRIRRICGSGRRPILP
jgi:hypothetical protein